MLENEINIEQFAKRINKCISSKGLTTSLLFEYKNPFPKTKIKGIRIPFFFIISHLKGHFSLNKKNQFSLLNPPFKQTVNQTHSCCSKQDFHLLPFKKILLEHALTMRNIVGLKILQPFFTKKQFSYFIKQSSIHSKKHSVIKVTSKEDKV